MKFISYIIWRLRTLNEVILIVFYVFCLYAFLQSIWVYNSYIILGLMIFIMASIIFGIVGIPIIQWIIKDYKRWKRLNW